MFFFVCFFLFFSNKNDFEVLACGSVFSLQQYLASYIKGNITTITNLSKDVKRFYCSTALIVLLLYPSLLQNVWSHWFVRRKPQRTELKTDVVIEISIYSCYKAIVNISCHHNLSGSEISKTLSWSKMLWLL